MKRFKTLRVRFALWTASLLLAALALFGGFVYANMARSLAAAVDETLHFTAVHLSAEVKMQRGRLVVDENPLQDAEYAQLREQGLSMRVLDLKGQAVAEYGPYSYLLQPPLAFTDVNHPGQFTLITTPTTQDLMRVYIMPVVDGGAVVGALQVVASLGHINRTLNLLLATLLVGVPITVLLAGCAGYFLAGRALAPIDSITQTARHISANDLTARLNLPDTDDEVGRLAVTLDSMLARLEQAFRRERQFTADASHELRTPLSAIQTIIGATLARPRVPAEYEQALYDLNHEAGRMRNLIEGLLHLARSDSAQQSTKFEQIDLALLLKDLVDSLEPLAEAKGLKLIVNIPNEPLMVMGDSDGLIRLFVNLVNNGIKFTDRGAVTITAKQQGEQQVAVTIADSGIGIAPEHLPHIFERFYRVDDVRSNNHTSSDGIGLGLAIAQDIVRTHAGEIAVESVVGKGTTFTVRLVGSLDG